MRKTKHSMLLASLLLGGGAISVALSDELATSEDEVYVGESVISASGYEQNLKDAPASVSVVKAQDIKSRPVRDIAEAISNVPGVSIDSSVSKTGGYGISIRGMGSAYTLILSDGKRTNGDSSLFPNGFGDSVTSFMPPLSAIERIEVIRGPASTLYGSDAMGGVVNIITKKNFERWGVSVGANYTAQESKAFGDTMGFNLYTAGPLNEAKNWGLIFRGNFQNRLSARSLKVVPANGNTLKDASRNQIVGLAPMLGYNLGTRILWSDTNTTHSGAPLNSVYFDVDYAQLSYDNKKGLLGDYKGDRAANGYGADMNIYRFNSIVNHKGNYIDDSNATLQKLSVETSLQYNLTANPDRFIPKDAFSNNATSAHGVSKGDSRALIGNDIILDSKAQMLFYFNPIVSLNLTAGARYWYNNFKDNLFAVAGKKALQEQHIGAIFSEGEVMLVDSVFITAGVRGNFNSIFGANASPRAYIAYNAIDKWLTIKGGVSTGYKTPALSNLINGVANLSGQGTTHTYGNPKLKPESSVNYELSIISDNDYFNASLTGFYTDFSDKITTISGAPAGFSCSATGTNGGGGGGGNGGSCSHYINADRAITYGAEVALGIKPIFVGYGDVSFDSAYTFTHSKVTKGKNKGERLTNVPLHNFNASLNYDSEYFGGYLRGEIKAGIYRAGSGRGNDNGAKERAALGEFYKPIYLMHLGFYGVPMKNLRINFAIYNLLGQNFIDYVAYNGSTYANNYNYIREGRRYFLSLQYEF
ncbi:TonB-dependent receptor domain-containing protein [Helicobacter sp. 23-1045]